jgi:hypothetical protein
MCLDLNFCGVPCPGVGSAAKIRSGYRPKLLFFVLVDIRFSVRFLLRSLLPSGARQDSARVNFHRGGFWSSRSLVARRFGVLLTSPHNQTEILSHDLFLCFVLGPIDLNRAGVLLISIFSASVLCRCGFSFDSPSSRLSLALENLCSRPKSRLPVLTQNRS